MTDQEKTDWAAGYTTRLACRGFHADALLGRSTAWGDGYARADYNLSKDGSFVKLSADALAEALEGLEA